MEMCETCQPEQLGLLPADSLASLSVLPGSKEAQAMTVGSGRKWLELLNVSGRLGYWLRMCLESSAWNSTRCYLTWNASTTPHGRLLFRLSASMPRTEESGFGLWVTPAAADSQGSTGGGQGRSLRTDVRMFPTPTKAIADGGQTSRSGKRKSELLLTGIAKMFPTPTARDWKDGASIGSAPENGLLGRVVNPSPATGSLNPNWVEWLMGYPVGWTDLEDSETP
mgnify:CR=1 FL=1